MYHYPQNVWYLEKNKQQPKTMILQIDDAAVHKTLSIRDDALKQAGQLRKKKQKPIVKKFTNIS